MKAVLIALALALGAAPVWAQDGDQPALVEALVVNARTPGPAWWSVSKGDVKVWVLGVGVPVPADTKWDSNAFEKRVKAARRVLLIPNSKTKFESAAIKADRDWRQELTETERARLAEIAAASRRKPDFYYLFRPNFAGVLIKSDLDARTKPKPGKSQDLQARAQRLGAKIIPVSGDFAQGMRASLKAGERDGLSCLRWAMRPRDPAALRQQRAKAWIAGDVRALMLGPAAYDPCVQAMSAMQVSLQDSEGQMADAIAAKADQGEAAVAFVGLTPLLREGGVLDQLRRRGYRVETPAQMDDE